MCCRRGVVEERAQAEAGSREKSSLLGKTARRPTEVCAMERNQTSQREQKKERNENQRTPVLGTGLVMVGKVFVSAAKTDYGN